MFYFYKLTNPIGKFYIGQTDNLIRRKREYKNIKSIKQQKLIYQSLKKYGYDNHKFEIIYRTLCDSEKANGIEINLIDKFNSCWYRNKKHGLNLTYGGESGRRGIPHSEETKLKMKNAYSEERKIKFSERSKNRIRSEEEKMKMRLRMNSPEQKEILLKNRKVFVGSEHFKTKLTEEIVYKIKLDVKSGIKRSITLEKFKISKKIYQNIKSETGWKHVKLTDEDCEINKPKKVFQYDLDGNFIKEWESIKIINKQFNLNSSIIRYCCEKKIGYTQGGGFKWSYLSDDNEKVKKINRTIRPEHYVKIDQFDKDGNFIKTWNSIKEAEQQLNISRVQISDCCRKKCKSTKGFIFSYTETTHQDNEKMAETV